MNLPLIVCAILGASSVLLGAYGAHGLVEKFSVFPKMKTAYENAVDYQMYHSLVILVLGVSSYIPRIKMPTYLWGSFTLSIFSFLSLFTSGCWGGLAGWFKSLLGAE